MGHAENHRPSAVEESRCITLGYHCGLLRLRFAPLGMRSSANPTATKHNVTIVKHRCLPRSHSPLRIVQPHVGAPVFDLRQRSACPWVAITDLYCCLDFFAVAGFDDHGSFLVIAITDSGDGMPIHSIELEFVR